MTAIVIALGIAALILHELAHGWAAAALGDDTARRAGRLSLNPLRHVDPVGTLLLPGLLIGSQLLTLGRIAFLFGWARPVPVDARRFAHPRQGMALVAAAGPAMNLALAFAAVLLLRASALPPKVLEAADAFAVLNLALALFNLLPIPPLDGGRIAVGLLPLPAARAWARLERVGLPLVMGLLLLGAVLQDSRFDTVHRVLTPAIAWTYGAMLHIAGVQNVGI